MSLDLSPAPGAAPTRRRVLSQARIEALLLARNGEQLLLALVIPIGALVAARVAGARLGWTMGTAAPSVLGLALWSTTFTSLAIATGFERRYGVLERLAATPLGRGGLAAGKATAVALVALVQVVLLAGVALALGWRPHPTAVGTVAALVGCLFASGAFAGLALVMAGRLRAEATLALANLVYLAGTVAGLVVPTSAWPSSLRDVVSLLPTGALGNLLRAWAAGGLEGAAVLVSGVWAALTLLVARKVFRWTS